MKCPLMVTRILDPTDETKGKFTNCLKEECPWWNEDLEQCDPTGLLPWFIALVSLLEDIVDKMPNERQFRT